MPYYETVFIARQDLNEGQVKELAEGYKSHIENEGGTVNKTEFWGLKTLAYKINKNRRGYYVLIESDVAAPAIHEMERTMRLNEDILRFMTLKLEAPTDGPSVMMAGDDRDDRNDAKGKGGKYADNKTTNKEAA